MVKAEAWTQERDARLRALWDEGLTTAEIGRQMGASKNAIVGRAHRLKLPSRPSPILAAAPRRAKRLLGAAAAARQRSQGVRPLVGVGGAAQVARLNEITEKARAETPRVYARLAGGEGPSLNPQSPTAGHLIPAMAGDPTAAAAAASGCEAVRLDVSSLTLPAPLVAVLPAARGFSPRDPRGCRWPEGDPRSEGFRFCAEAVRVRPDGRFCVYCPTHAARAYTVRAADAGNPSPIGRTKGWGRAA